MMDLQYQELRGPDWKIGWLPELAFNAALRVTLRAVSTCMIVLPVTHPDLICQSVQIIQIHRRTRVSIAASLVTGKEVM
jgi:hypothetical protein